MKAPLVKVLAAIAAAGALGGFLVTWSGIVDIGASSGHWPGMSWFLHFAMRQSVERHASGIAVPPLADDSLVMLGAAHYETGCAPCHGGPGDRRTPIVRRMTPPAPFLPDTVTEWQPNELFWIVRHGLKYTGMPAWVAQERPDEVWAVVAFLLRMPEIDAQTYERLAFGDAVDAGATNGAAELHALDATSAREFSECARCHGRDGAGHGPIPQLAGQSEDYLYASLQSYAAGRRASGIMQPVAAALSDVAMRRAAARYTGIEPRALESAAIDGVARRRGAHIARNGLPAQDVPACTHCHGPDPVADNSLFPRLAGQPVDYLALQLELWKTGRRGGSAYAALMHAAARQLHPGQIRDVAAYFASLEPAREASNRRAATESMTAPQ
ncbi:c-type cytochrome [soil metagenome]